MRWNVIFAWACWVGLAVSGASGTLLYWLALLPAKTPTSRRAAFQKLLRRNGSWKFLLCTSLAADAVIFLFCLNALTSRP